MARVPYVRSDDAPEPARRRLQSFEADHGKRSLLLEALANHPPLLAAHAEYFDRTVGSGSLDRELKELVGVVVSEANDCPYCLDSHRGNLLDMFGVAPETVAAAEAGEFDALSGRRRAALAFARAVATDPKRAGAEFEALRKAGFADGEVVELLGAVGQFLVANVYADALGIHPGDRD